MKPTGIVVMPSKAYIRVVVVPAWAARFWRETSEDKTTNHTQMKRVTLSLIAAFLTMFVLGGLWNALIMENFYLSHSPSIIRPPEAFNLPVIALGYFVLTAIMTLIVVQNFNENPKFIGGFMFGATFGIAATLPLYLILWGRWDFSMSYVLVDSIWHLFEEGIGAVVLCKVFYGTGMKKEVLTS